MRPAACCPTCEAVVCVRPDGRLYKHKAYFGQPAGRFMSNSWCPANIFWHGHRGDAQAIKEAAVARRMRRAALSD